MEMQRELMSEAYQRELMSEAYTMINALQRHNEGNWWHLLMLMKFLCYT